MSIRAKFYVGEKITRASGNKDSTSTQVIKLFPVTHGSEENELFYRYTPYGSIELGLLNEETGKKFELGKEYYIDFTLAE